MNSPCPKCGRLTLRCKVEALLDIPAHLEHQLTKFRMRSREVHLDGVNWPKARLYCTSCDFTERRG